jgi:hypothetical protein
VALLASPTRCRKEELTALLKRVLVDNRVQFIFFSYEAQKKGALTPGRATCLVR